MPSSLPSSAPVVGFSGEFGRIVQTIIQVIPAFGWLLVSVSFFAYGEFLSKKWADHPSVSLAIAVVAIDAIGTALWLPAILHKNTLAIVGLLWLLIGAVATVSIGLFVFKETLDWSCLLYTSDAADE